ncbi:beta-ketoacyl-ACP synthase III [Actinomadura kijaniata]|uniref:beta-ketoacyl-ACP synthase III n=1 Tax=Actinomadura kijaniata TaxID=46161 RepID=UPI003F1B16DE
MTGAVTFRVPPTVPGSRVLAFGDYQPSRVVTNDDLAEMVDTNDEWIRSRVGIRERRIAGPEETIVDMAVQAGGKALAASGLAPDDIDLVIVATCSAETPMPNNAPSVAYRLGLDAPGAYDLNSACSGFCYALSAADSAIRTGAARNALVIGAEKMSQWLDWSDRSTCIIFADGAGAAVVAASDAPGVGPVVWGSAGDQSDRIMIKGRESFILQDGQAVFRWATTAIAPVALEACERAGVAPRDLAAIVPHQANLRIIDAIARKIKAPDAVVARDIVTAGNTSGASIPMALARMIERGEVPSGAPALLVGFGAGLAYAAQVIQIP